MFNILKKNDSVADLWNESDNKERWRFLWRRRFFEWEQQLFGELQEVIAQATVGEEEDRWCWRPNCGAGLTVKSAYQLVSSLFTQWHAKIFNSFGSVQLHQKSVALCGNCYTTEFLRKETWLLDK
jgi:hypothetical protein